MAIKQDEIKVVVGAGVFNNNPGWVQTQEDELNLLDNTTWEERFEYNSISAILAEHVWEHLTFEEGVKAAEICYKFLKPSGHIRCGVPDAFFRDETYQNIVQIGGPGPKDHPAASHKIVHNYKTLTKMFEIAGFEVVLLNIVMKMVNFITQNGMRMTALFSVRKGMILEIEAINLVFHR